MKIRTLERYYSIISVCTHVLVLQLRADPSISRRETYVFICTPVSALFQFNNIAGAEPKSCYIIVGSRVPVVRSKFKKKKKEWERTRFFYIMSFIDDFVTSCFNLPPGISGLYNNRKSISTCVFVGIAAIILADRLNY